MRKLVVEYNKQHKHEDGTIEPVPQTISMNVFEENGFIILKFVQETFMDVLKIAKDNGLNISVKE